MPLKGFGVNQRLQVLQLPDLSRSPTPMWLVYPFLGNREVADLSRPSADPRARACLLFHHGDVLGPFADISKPPPSPLLPANQSFLSATNYATRYAVAAAPQRLTQSIPVHLPRLKRRMRSMPKRSRSFAPTQKRTGRRALPDAMP